MTLTPPRASFSQSGRQTGTLSVDLSSGTATFTSRAGSMLVLRGIHRVGMGGRGTDFVSTWIEVRSASEPSTVSFNDGRRLGWRALLTGSNSRIAGALVACAPTSGPATS